MKAVISTTIVIIGEMIDMLVKGGLPLRVRDLLMRSLSLYTLFIGTSGVVSAVMQVDDTHLRANGTLLLICSLGVGAITEELLRLEDRMERLAHRLQSMAKSRDDKFVGGFVSNALVICVGAMTAVGALQGRLTHDASMLITKAILDGIISVVFAPALRIGVVFAAILPFLYQGAITILAEILSLLFSDTLIRNLSLIGNVLILGVRISLLFGKQMGTDNPLPTLLIPVVWEALQCLVSGMR